MLTYLASHSTGTALTRCSFQVHAIGSIRAQSSRSDRTQRFESGDSERAAAESTGWARISRAQESKAAFQRGRT